MNKYSQFSQEDIEAHKPEMKIGLVATVNQQGQPHITLLSTLRAFSSTEMVWGQFAEGMSKENIQQNPKTGWLILTLEKQIWRGKATFTHTAITGPEFEFFNNTPLFRYNAYFGIHKVYYMDLIEQSGREALPMNSVVIAAVKSLAAKTISPQKSALKVLNTWTRNLIGKLDNLKFISYVDGDGFPVIVPVIQGQISGTSEVIFSTGAYGDELMKIPAGAPMAFFCMSFSMEDVLLRGTFKGISARGGFQCGAMDVDWVYSPMPPVAGQVYPPVELAAIREFD